MSTQKLLKSQLKEELDTAFDKRISFLRDEIGRRERTPYSDPEVQKVELARYNYKLAAAIIAKDQLQDLIKKHVKK